MKESEYIISTNRAKISVAIHCIRDVLSGDNYGVSYQERSDLLKKLFDIEQRLFGQTTISDEE